MATSTRVAPNQVARLPKSESAAADEFALLEGTRLEPWDIAVIVAYFVIVLGFGLWVSFVKSCCHAHKFLKLLSAKEPSAQK